jgi:hypothetical protein
MAIAAAFNPMFSKKISAQLVVLQSTRAFFAKEGLDVAHELIFPVNESYAALRDGRVDFVGGSAHFELAAFPEFKGVKLLCAQGQGRYWFLVLHSDLHPVPTI